MTDQQPEALKLADRTNEYHGPHAQALAAAVRHLHAENEAHRAELEGVRNIVNGLTVGGGGGAG